MSAYQKILREVKLRVNLEVISVREDEQIREALESIRAERGSFRGLNSRDLAKLVIVKVNGFKNSSTHTSSSEIPEIRCRENETEGANEVAMLDDNNNAIKAASVSLKELRNDGLMSCYQDKLTTNYEQKMNVENSLICSGKSCADDSKTIVPALLHHQKSTGKVVTTDENSVLSNSEVVNAVEKHGDQEHAAVSRRNLSLLSDDPTVSERIAGPKNESQNKSPVETERGISTLSNVSTVSNVHLVKTEATEMNHVASCVEASEQQITLNALKTSPQFSDGTYSSGSAKPQRQRDSHQRRQQTSSISVSPKTNRNSDEENVHGEQMAELFFNDQKYEMEKNSKSDDLNFIASRQQNGSGSTMFDTSKQPRPVESLNGNYSRVNLPSNIQILPSSEYPASAIDSGSLLTGRVLIKDFIPYAIEKCGGLDPSYWEVVSILSSFWRERHPEGFDRFKSPDMLLDEVKKRLVDNREFKKVIDKVSNIDKCNSICNGEYFISPVDKLTEETENTHIGAKSSNDFLASCNFLNSSVSAKSSCNSSKSISSSSSLDFSSSLEGAVFSNVSVNPVSLMKDISKEEGSLETEALTGAVRGISENLNLQIESKKSFPPKIQPIQTSNEKAPFSKPPFPKSLPAATKFANSHSTDSPPPGFGDVIFDKKTKSPANIATCAPQLVRKTTEVEAVNAKSQLKPSLSDMGSLGSTSQESSANTGDSKSGYAMTIERLPLLQRRGSGEGKVSCRQCANSLVPGKGKLEVMSCGHWLHQSCQRMNSTGCPNSCSRHPSTANSLVNMNQPLSQV